MSFGANYQVALDVFEGPLDLLLHLVKKHERELLPNPEPEPTEELDEDAPIEEIDTRAELIKRLLEYQKYKEAANRLGDRPVVGRNVWGRGTALEDALAEGIDAEAVAPLAPFPVHRLIEALDRLMRSAKIKVTHNVLIDRLSVSQRISELTDRLEREGTFTFTSMFRFAQPDVEMTYAEIKHEAVVTLLAVLEMAKLRLISIRQDEGELEIMISRVAADLREAVARSVAGSDEYR